MSTTESTPSFADLSPAKRELLLRRLAKAKGETPETVAPRRRRPEGHLPLSFSQQRLWFLDQLESNRSIYNLCGAHRLRGPLDERALARTLAEVVRRHQALRTTFPTVDGRPVQKIARRLAVALPIVDLSALPEPCQRRCEAERLASREGARPFDLARGPLLRVQLVRLAEDDRALLLEIHHIVSDGWSMRVLMSELLALYRAFAVGEPSPLPELSYQYADFALDERERMTGEALAEHLGYWKRQLAGAPAFLELPTDRPRPAVQSFRGRRLPLVIDGERLAALRDCARRHGMTVFMVLLAAFDCLLHRTTGQTDIVVGAPTANRGHLEKERLIGFFVNTLVLRVDLSGDPTFRKLLERTRQVVLDAQDHQDVPFEKLVEELGPERSLSRTPLFQALFAFQSIPGGGAGEAAGLASEPLAVERRTTLFDLTLNLDEASRVAGFFEYAADLFDAARIRRLAGHLTRLLDVAVADPEVRLSRLGLLPPAERQQLTLEWNDSRAPYPPARALHLLIENQVDLTPDAGALVYEDRWLSYRELDDRSNLLAHRLRSLGVAPDVLVGISAERSLELVVGLLGILKAGGAYVPLDPSYPRERLAFMMEDARVPVLLTQKRLADVVPAGAAAVLRLDADWPCIAAESRARPAWQGTPESLAYAIFTSGSTGRPKGAMNSHRAIVNRLFWMQGAFGLTPEDRVLQKTPFSFDVSVWEFFWPLIYGARLVVARPEGHKDGAYLVRLIVRQAVTTLHFVPSMLQVFVEQPGVEECRSLRRVIASGEALPYELEQRFFARLGGELHNLYGPTEAAVDVTWQACAPSASRRPVAIGRPVANTGIHLFDRGLLPAPIGVPGELHIGGIQLARGYLGRPGLTADRFSPDPLSGPGGRLYRTGDLARHLPGGAVEYLGRLDFQVKLRGQRIELGEIEAELGALPGVSETVVLARQDTPGDPRLVAYVVPEDADVSALRAALRDKLPEYMVPSAFVGLAALPLNPNGKVDRRALPAPRTDRAAAETAYAAPRNPVEELLAAIWAAVLERERIGVHDHFFHLGGHSLVATRVIARLRRRLGVEIELRELFENPTLEGLAGRVERALRAGTEPAPPIRHADRRRPLPLSFGQERLWFLAQLDPGIAAYNLPVAVRLLGPLDPAALAAALSEVVRRHEALRTVFVVDGEDPVQRVLDPAPVAFPVVEVVSGDVGRLMSEAARRPFDLASGPLLRATLLRLGEAEHVLALVMHHIVSDGWSLGVLVRELVALYAGRDLPEPALQYADYAAWQREWLAGDALAAQVGYWRGQLGPERAILELPTDRPRPPVQTFRGARRTRHIAGAGLAELARAEDVTLFMALVAAFQVLLHRVTGEVAIALGTPIANRTRAEVEDLIGFFVNTLVLRTRLDGRPSFRELLARVREVTLGAYAHQDLPFEKLVEELDPERNLSQAPLFQVMFQLQVPELSDLSDLSDLSNLSDSARGGLRLERLPVDLGAAKFDLTLAVEELAGGGLAAAAEYNADLFDATTMERFLAHFATLAGGAAAGPGRPIGALSLLSAPEAHQLRAEWNDTAPPAAPPATVAALFEAQAAQTPEAEAVVFAERPMSFRDLDRRSNQLARELRGLGVRPETLVGVLLERSFDLVVGILGVLKAGAAYLPLDPAYPRERLAFMLEDSGAPVVLTHRRFNELVPAGKAEILALDVASRRLDAHAAEPLLPAAGPGNLVYAVYTSGSTGRPKAVAIEHRSVAALLRWAARVFAPEELRGLLASTSICFDLSVFELFLPLAYGGRVILAENALHLPSLPARGEVTLVNTVPSAMAELVADRALPAPARTVTLCGEPLRRDLADAIYASGTVERLINFYGPSEDTTYSTWTCVRSGPEAPSIGVPIAGSHARVVDRGLVTVPIGVPGELCLAGAGLARGYLGRPARTAERFVPDPFAACPGRRLYRTGDRVLYLRSGELEFLGRFDHQVKLRGFRVELGEVETVLRRHPAIAAAVAAVATLAELPQLVAYVVAAAAAPPGADELTSFLAATLPAHMIPSIFVTLEALPLTANGKVDRAALPAPGEAGRGHAYEAPHSVTEQRVAGVWREVLGVERVGLDDNFFELGGHSLLMVRAFNRLKAAFDPPLELPLVRAFEHPTVRVLARFLDRGEEREPAPRDRGRDRGARRREALERRRRRGKVAV